MNIIKHILHFFEGHDWKWIKATAYIDSSFGMRVESTNCVKQCQKCGKLTWKLFYGYGFLTLEQLNLKSK